jgi:organic hydroperoxide reductase OsmC/OhrA
MSAFGGKADISRTFPQVRGIELAHELGQTHRFIAVRASAPTRTEKSGTIFNNRWRSAERRCAVQRLRRAGACPIWKNMSEYKVTLKWERGGAEFSYQKYPRDHTWSFDGGHTMTATAAPAYLGNPAHVDPEEAFVASLSSCHMLTFLAIACKQKFVLDSYEDEAVGHLEKNADGRLAITRVELRPKITWGGDRKPSAEELDKMHHAAHENCFIANSVKTEVRVTKI